MGALTSKKGAFSFRCWEQKTFKEYDDVNLLASLKVRVEKIKTQRTRILPIYHWMTNRKRFSSLNRLHEYGFLAHSILKNIFSFRIKKNISFKAHVLKVYSELLQGFSFLGGTTDAWPAKEDEICQPGEAEREWWEMQFYNRDIREPEDYDGNYWMYIENDKKSHLYAYNYFFFDKALANKNLKYLLESPLLFRNYFDLLSSKKNFTTKVVKAKNFYYTHYFEEKLDNVDNIFC